MLLMRWTGKDLSDESMEFLQRLKPATPRLGFTGISCRRQIQLALMTMTLACIGSDYFGLL